MQRLSILQVLGVLLLSYRPMLLEQLRCRQVVQQIEIMEFWLVPAKVFRSPGQISASRHISHFNSAA